MLFLLTPCNGMLQILTKNNPLNINLQISHLSQVNYVFILHNKIISTYTQ